MSIKSDLIIYRSKVFQVAYVIIKSGISPRPGNWILERSIDGVDFSAWQFYALSDGECQSRYAMEPRQGNPTYGADAEVICTSFYSKLNPLENGEVSHLRQLTRPSVGSYTSYSFKKKIFSMFNCR